jgi:hypothetical protein
MFCLLSIVKIARTQTFQSKNAGVCFRFDDFQNTDKLKRVRLLFNKHGVKFTHAINTSIGDIFGDAAYWAEIKQMETDGHEIADQSPTDVSNFFETKILSDALAFANRPGVDHIDQTSNKVCLNYLLLKTTGSGDEGKVDISGSRIISKSNGEFAWPKLVNNRYQTHIWIPSMNKLVTYVNVYNANASDPDTLIVKSFWKEDINLGNATNVVFRKITPYEMTVTKEGLQIMSEYSLKLFAKFGLKKPVSFIHPGGGHPYVSKQGIREALFSMGYLGGATYPFETNGIANYNPFGLNQYTLQGGDVSPEQTTVTDFKKYVVEFYAKNRVVVSINHLSSFGGSVTFDQMLLNLEEIIVWCKANNIPIKTYKDWNKLLSDEYFDLADDYFPPLQNDFNADAIPDGLTMSNPSILDKTNGLPYNKNVCFAPNANGNVFSIQGLYGLNKGKNTISISTKGGTDIYDYFSMVVDFPETNVSRNYTVFTNTANYTERNFDFEVPYGVTYLNIVLNYNTDKSKKVFASGIKIVSNNRPTFKTPIIEREAKDSFASIDLSAYAASKGVAPSVLTFGIVKNANNLTGTIVNVNKLNLIPKNNRFWIGNDSIRIFAKAPDNSADTTWIQIVSRASKACIGSYTNVSVNVDPTNDKSYKWTSNPIDNNFNGSVASTAWAKVVVNSSYTNTITFKSNATRTDAVSIGTLASTISGNKPFELKRFNGANSVAFTLNYPAHYKVYLSEMPSASGSVNINGLNVTLNRSPSFIGNFETKLFVTTPTCDAFIHTLVATTYATGLDQTEKVKDFIAYPNPFMSTIELTELPLGSTKIEVFNLAGELIFEDTIKKDHLSLSTQDWNSGLYVLKLTLENQVIAKKIIKMN